MEAGTIPDNDVFVIRILHFDLIQKSLRSLQVQRQSLEEDCLALNQINSSIRICFAIVYADVAL